MKFPAHTGTHVDAPGHLIHEAYEQGRGVESLSLDVLNGPALIVEVPPGHNITAKVLQNLQIPPSTKRLLLKTDNTAKGLMTKTAFDTSYTGVTTDGAQWLVDNTNISLIGNDYLTIAVYDDLMGPHEVLMGQGVMIVEGLDFRAIEPGLYMLHCLPLKLVGSDGAPVRCIAEV
ncbi:hypothetical protein WJX72_003393 [[Myrmecia] bisecta]|uniref:Cyclase n=1 Tax=[Myrmecia] bisecta TaxID=41462 RepID=A0AAW1PNR6_9CHLO